MEPLPLPVAMVLGSQMTVSWQSHVIRANTLLGSQQSYTASTRLDQRRASSVPLDQQV